jgi:hypothetical protein
MSSNINPLSNVPTPNRDKEDRALEKPTSKPQTDRQFQQVRQSKERKPDITPEKKSDDQPVKKSSLFDLPKTQRKPARDEEEGELTGVTPKKTEEQPEVDEEGKQPEMEEADAEFGKEKQPLDGKQLPPGVGQSKLQQQQQELLAKTEGLSKKGESFEELGTKKISTTEKGEGRPELAALDQQSKQNPFAAASTQIDTKVGKEESAKPSETIQQIADKIVEKLQVVRTGDKIDTTITLKSPPMLDGASITVTSSATAKGEISLAFSNLSPEGKALIDQNSAQLKLALEKNGYTVHDVVSVPKEIQAAPISAEQTSKDQREDQRERGGKGGGGGDKGEGRGGGGGDRGQQQQQRNR